MSRWRNGLALLQPIAMPSARTWVRFPPTTSGFSACKKDFSLTNPNHNADICAARLNNVAKRLSGTHEQTKSREIRNNYTTYQTMLKWMTQMLSDSSWKKEERILINCLCGVLIITHKTTSRNSDRKPDKKCSLNLDRRHSTVDRIWETNIWQNMSTALSKKTS